MVQKEEVMTVDSISNRVYVIRGQQVMLDYDLAEIYGYEVKRLNEQVKKYVPSTNWKIIRFDLAFFNNINPGSDF